MTQSPNASSRPSSDEFQFSSVINRQVATFLERLSGQISASSARARGSSGIEFAANRVRSFVSRWRSPLFMLIAALVLAGCQAETAPLAKIERPVQVQRVAFENGAAAREFVASASAARSSSASSMSATACGSAT
jgi:hypothetical protein